MKIDIFDKNHTDFVYQAEILLERNDLSEALNLALERLRSFPADADAIVIACSALVGMGRLEEVRQILQDVGELMAGLTFVYERAGDVCREKGYDQDAAACYEKFLSMHPDAEKAREVIGKMALLGQNDNPVASVIEEVPRENIPEQEFFTTTLAELYIKQGHLPDAEVILEEIIKKDPHHIQALNMLDNLRASRVVQSAKKGENLKNEKLIATLSAWLKNIERLRINAAKK